jgi:serine/threonine protein kinase/tetratricopeptide (TPR) repeat protein
VAEKPVDDTSRGWRRALRGWFTAETPSPGPSAPSENASRGEGSGRADSSGLPARFAHYAIVRKLGEGGMGVVYTARDERLQRTIALKTMSSPAGDETARKRFWREARAAANVNHPNICQIHEIGEDAGVLFIAMELLEGESLADRLRHGPLHVDEAVPIALGLLAGLAAIHNGGFVHRDLKPTNVFLTPHGVKLLDFGLARPEAVPSLGSADGLTLTGTVIGTPRYMAPEQINGEPVDARGDLFAAGAILFEMLSGRPAFGGRTIAEVLHATLHEQPPALAGPPVVVALDRVIRRAVAKHPSSRPISAEAMAEELREVAMDAEKGGARAIAQTLTRVVVLPFRVLRPDPETDFLAFSLPDAIATSLASIGSLVVRSSATAAKFAGETPDLKALAAAADVDRVVLGTLLRIGSELRVTAQLIEAPAGTLLTSQTIQTSLGDLFRLQDDLARGIVDALALPLAPQATPPPTPRQPRNSEAYELYLRANELARSYNGVERARDLYVRALDLDPRFAPAWAQLGRCHRIVGKYIDGTGNLQAQAEDAFQRALQLDPRLSLAHKFYAQLEADSGRAQHALVRLLGEAGRHGNDPELFAGLVHVCRYCGLYEQSMAAHAEARRLDPNVTTSIEQTLLMGGATDKLLELQRMNDPSADGGARIMTLGFAGRLEEARQILLQMRKGMNLPAFEVWGEYLMAWLERRPADMVRGVLGGMDIDHDPEAIFLQGWMLCDAGAPQAGVDHLRRAVASGYAGVQTLATSHAFDAVRSDPAFQSILADARASRETALTAFTGAGGEALLGHASR